MKNKFTSIFGSIAAAATLAAQFNFHLVVKGHDLVGIVGAAALAGLGIASKDWKTKDPVQK